MDPLLKVILPTFNMAHEEIENLDKKIVEVKIELIATTYNDENEGSSYLKRFSGVSFLTFPASPDIAYDKMFNHLSRRDELSPFYRKSLKVNLCSQKAAEIQVRFIYTLEDRSIIPLGKVNFSIK